MKRFAIFIGIDAYNNGITPLRCACNDAKQLSMKFAAAGFETPDLILNDEASCVPVIKKIKTLMTKIDSGDLLIFYFAGHGRELNGEHYLVGRNGEADATLFSIDTLPVSTLVATTNKPGVRRLFILDCCRDNLLAGRSTAYACEESRSIALNNAVKMQSGFIPPLILNSCSSGEKAFEDPASGHGYFTKALLQTIGASGIGNFSAFRRQLKQNMPAGIAQNICWNGNVDDWDDVKLFAAWNAAPVQQAAPAVAPAAIPDNFYELQWDVQKWQKKLAQNQIALSEDLQRVQWIADSAEKRGDYSTAVDNLRLFIALAAKEFQLFEERRKAEAAARFEKLSESEKKYLPDAQAGDPDAQFNLAWCYYNGEGVDKDLKQAVLWYTKAAEQGFANAQFNLGVCYGNGEGVDKDLKQAVLWWIKAAEQGLPGAQFNLALCYANGKGVDKDLKQAVLWYTKAAEQGFANAQFNLGACYGNGYGVDKDLKQAVLWWIKAAEQGYTYAQFNLGVCYGNGCGVDKDLKQAVLWYTKAAEQGDTRAQFNLAWCYEYGEGVAKDLKQAVLWYTKAAEQGHAKAQFNLAQCYANGYGVDKDLKQAVLWYTKAAEQGDANAQKALTRLGH